MPEIEPCRAGYTGRGKAYVYTVHCTFVHKYSIQYVTMNSRGQLYNIIFNYSQLLQVYTTHSHAVTPVLGTDILCTGTKNLGLCLLHRS